MTAKVQLTKIVKEYAAEVDRVNALPPSRARAVQLLIQQELLGNALDTLYFLAGYAHPHRNHVKEWGRRKLHFDTSRGRFLLENLDTGEISHPKPAPGCRYIHIAGQHLTCLAFSYYYGREPNGLVFTITGNPCDLRWSNIIEWRHGPQPESTVARVRRRLHKYPI